MREVNAAETKNEISKHRDILVNFLVEAKYGVCILNFLSSHITFFPNSSLWIPESVLQMQTFLVPRYPGSLVTVKGKCLSCQETTEFLSMSLLMTKKRIIGWKNANSISSKDVRIFSLVKYRLPFPVSLFTFDSEKEWKYRDQSGSMILNGDQKGFRSKIEDHKEDTRRRIPGGSKRKEKRNGDKKN